MIRGLILLACLVPTACSQVAGPENEVVVANAVEPAARECALPMLSLADGAPLESRLFDETKANFTIAFRSACAKGTLEARELIDPKPGEQGKLFLINAPEANVASIYLSKVDGNRMVLEYPFLTVDGKSQVPSATELEEAIYCAVVGATPEEQESSGRCLVD